MILAIDVGGTKTLLGVFDETGNLTNSVRFATPKDYKEFINALAKNVADLSTSGWTACCVALPGVIDREHGVGIVFGNLDWKNIPVRDDLQKLLECPVFVENDAKLGALAEAVARPNYKRLLYITISTGIGAALVVGGVIDTNFADSGANSVYIEHDGKRASFESFASGHAITEEYGKQASDINDPATWRAIATDMAAGLFNFIALTLPDVVIIGGGVGAHFDKFAEPLQEELSKLTTHMVSIPAIEEAKHPEEAVIYGCYEFAKANQSA